MCPLFQSKLLTEYFWRMNCNFFVKAVRTISIFFFGGGGGGGVGIVKIRLHSTS